LRILITGASGLLGLNLALWIAGQSDHQNADRRHVVYGAVHRHILKTEAFQIFESDLLQPGAVERIFDQVQPEWVIHCAALADVDICEGDPARAAKMNTDLPELLATIVARGGARLLHISTDAVFDGQRGNYSEEDSPNPLSVYARTKLEGEYAVLEKDPRAIVARVNLFGWSLSGQRSLAEFFFNNLSGGKTVLGFTDVFFCPVLVNDLGQVFLKMLGLELSGLYHVVSSDCLSKYEFGARIARRFGLDENLIRPTSVLQAGLRAVRSPNLTLRTDKLRQALGRPTPAVAGGLDRFYALYQAGYPDQLRKMAVIVGG
jgi:dTDP-4-dehydrorhamnose reductase